MKYVPILFITTFLWSQETIENPNSIAVNQTDIQIISDDYTLILSLEGVLDVSSEINRLKKHINKINVDLNKVNTKLSNDKFLSNAPQHIITELKKKRLSIDETLIKLNLALNKINDMK